MATTEVNLPKPEAPKPESEAKPVTALARFEGQLAKMESQIARALPEHIGSKRLMQVVLTSVKRKPELMTCTPTTLWGSVLECAHLGLMPDSVLGQAYLIPYRNNRKGINECQLIVGYKGMTQLILRSGLVSWVSARVVYEKDYFEPTFGSQPNLVHKPYLGQDDPGPKVGVYCLMKLKDGTTEFEFMTMREIYAIRDRKDDWHKGPWKSDEDEMAKKTVIRRMFKLSPVSSDDLNLHRAIALDERADAGVSQEFDFIDVEGVSVDEEKPSNGNGSNGNGRSSKLDTVTDALKKTGAGNGQPPNAEAPEEKEPPRRKESKRDDPETYLKNLDPGKKLADYHVAFVKRYATAKGVDLSNVVGLIQANDLGKDIADVRQDDLPMIVEYINNPLGDE